MAALDLIAPNFITVMSVEDADLNYDNLTKAIEKMRDEGGGTVLLKAGQDDSGNWIPFNLRRTIVIDCIKEQRVNGNGKPYIYWHFPAHIRIAGDTPVNGTLNAEAHIRWIGAHDQAIFDVRHAHDICFENLLLTAGKTGMVQHRFLYGIFFHRTISHIIQPGKNPPIVKKEEVPPIPTALSVIDCTIAAGEGAFTCGLRVQENENAAAWDYYLDANCEGVYLENLYLLNASDDPNMPTPRGLGMNGCGIRLDGSQVQHNFFRNLHIHNCGTGVLVNAGQLLCINGQFSGNHQISEYDNWSEGGDFVFAGGYSGGQLIQGITSTGSWRFITARNLNVTKPNLQNGEYYASHLAIAIALVNNQIFDLQDPQGYALYADFGGPFTFTDCIFGDKNDAVAQRLFLSKGSQAVCCAWRCVFNHGGETPVLEDYLVREFESGGTDALYGDRPSGALLECEQWAFGTRQSLPTLGEPELYLRYRQTLPPSSLIRPYAQVSDLSIRPSATGVSINMLEYAQARKLMMGGVGDLPARQPLDNYVGVDFTPIIQDAIASLPAAGGSLLFPSGIYNLMTTLHLHNLQNIRFVGVGGRTPTYESGLDNIKGTAFAWEGKPNDPMILISGGSDGISFENIHFRTTWSPVEVLTKPDPKPPISIESMIKITGSSDKFWMWQCCCGWANNGSLESIGELGVCENFIHLDGSDDQPIGAVNCLAVSTVNCGGQAVLIDCRGSSEREFLFFGGTNSRREFYVGDRGGHFTWLGGGWGNNVQTNDGMQFNTRFHDPTAVEIAQATGPVYVAGIEIQDEYPCRILRTSEYEVSQGDLQGAGQVFVYGNNFYVIPNSHPDIDTRGKLAKSWGDGRMIDFRWRRRSEYVPELFIYGCLFCAADHGFVTDNPKQILRTPNPEVAKIFVGRLARAWAFGLLAEAGDHARDPDPFRTMLDQHDVLWEKDNVPAALGQSWFQDVCGRSYFTRSWHWPTRLPELQRIPIPFETRSRSFLHTELQRYGLEAVQAGVEHFPKPDTGEMVMHVLRADTPTQFRWWRAAGDAVGVGDKVEVHRSPGSITALLDQVLDDGSNMFPQQGTSAGFKQIASMGLGDLPCLLELRYVKPSGLVTYRRTVLLIPA